MHAAAPRHLGAGEAPAGDAASSGPGDAPSAGAATTMPILSLFLLLLALFVMLTSIANFEERRTAAVMGSLDATFRAADAGAANRALGSLAGPLIGAERLEARLHELIATEFPLQPVTLSRAGPTVVVALPTVAVFAADADRPRPRLTPFLKRLAALLAVPPAGLAYDTVVELGSREGAWRAAALARAFVAAGGDAARVGVALAPATADVRLKIEAFATGGGA